MVDRENEISELNHQEQIDIAMANMPDKIEQLTAVKEKVYIPSIQRNDMKSKKEFKVNYLVSDLNDEVSR